MIAPHLHYRLIDGAVDVVYEGIVLSLRITACHPIGHETELTTLLTYPVQP